MKGFLNNGYSRHMCYAVILVCLVFCHPESSAQQSTAENIEQLINEAQGNEKVDLLLEMSKVRWFQSFDESMEYATRGYQLAVELDYVEGMADALNRIGNVYYLLSNYDEVLETYKQAARIATELGDNRRMGIYLNNIGLLYRELALYDSAEVYLQEALEKKTLHGDRTLIASTLGNFGLLYRDLKQYDLSREYYSGQMQIAIDLSDTAEIARIHRQIGEIFYIDEQFPESIVHCREALLYATEIADTQSMAHSYYCSARALIANDELELALKDIEKSLELAVSSSSRTLRRDNYNLYYQYYKKSGNHRAALEYITLYNELKDSIRNDNATARYTQLERIFDIEKQNREIELLQKENEIQELQISRHGYITNLLLLTMIILVVFKFFAIYRFVVIHKTNRLLKIKIAELESTNEKLRLSTLSLEQLNVTKNRFFSIIAHDLKNPFNALLGFSEIISTTFHELKENEIREYIGFVHQSSRNLYKLLENLLKWSAAQTGTMHFLPEPFDLVSLVNSEMHFLRMAASKKQIKLLQDLPEELIINSDKLLLSSVIRNLTDNAIKFTRPGGDVRISARLENGDVVVEIMDSGIGIPAEMLKKLFSLNGDISRKGTNKEEGGGLGLILCKELMDRAGGDIGVESTPGEGSRFWLTLPVSGMN